jgi:3-hexulose-6-phosphate synthase/6-phospho-3-hexuloisomerase
MVDLIEVKDPVRRAVELERLGVDYICAHTGIDVQRDKAEEIDRKFETLSRLTSSVKVPVAAAGGIRADTARRIVKGGVKILIIGGAITRASNPEAATRKILEVIRG